MLSHWCKRCNTTTILSLCVQEFLQNYGFVVNIIFRSTEKGNGPLSCLFSHNGE